MAAKFVSPTRYPDVPSQEETRFIRRAERAIVDAKGKARPELKGEHGWTQLGMCESSFLHPSYVSNNIERRSAHELSIESFRRQYELPGKPVVLTGLMRDWAAKRKWTIERLTKKYRNQKFKCGEDDDGNSVKLKMKYYRYYAQTNRDDSPLYIFDSGFGEHRKKKSILEDYQVPDYFADDLFRYVSETRRPPYRWFVMGPPRSGTGIHIDPLGTSAWNAVVHGRKQWCIFPPNTPKAMVKPCTGEGGSQRSEAISWFRYVYPKCLLSSWPSEFRPFDFIQEAGEVVYVPGGWWHAVVNLDLSVAVTQNLVSPVTFHRVLPKTLRGRPKFAEKWLENLQKYRPEVASEAEQINLDANTGLPTSSSSSCSSSSLSSDSESYSDSEAEGEGKGRDNPQDSSMSECGRRTQGMKRPIQTTHLSKSVPDTKKVRESSLIDEDSR